MSGEAKVSGSYTRILFYAGLLVACVAGLWWVWSRPIAPQPEPAPPATETTPTPYPETVVDIKLQREQFFQAEALPEIVAADRRNREAAERCVQRIRDMSAKHRAGIQPFVEDLQSYGTRLGIIGRMPADWWYTQKSVLEMLNQKFDEHVFSKESLQSGIDGAIEAFNAELNANRLKMVMQIQAELTSSDLGDLPSIDAEEWSEEVRLASIDHLKGLGEESAQRFVITELLSGLGGSATTALVTAIGARIATTAATTAAIGGGATAGGAATGTGGGALAGPVGAGVGFAAGLVVGVVIDWWMSSEFEAKMTEQLETAIDDVEKMILEGPNEQQPGLQQMLEESCDAMREAWHDSIHERLLEGT